MRHSKAKRAGAAAQPVSKAPSRPAMGQPGDALRVKRARNKANTIRNSAKVEHYLMEVERIHGFAKSWAYRERLEQGQVSLEELMRR